MLNKLLAMVRQYRMVEPGDRVICAVSGGADSVALLFAMYLLRGKLGISLEAAHYNHGLRSEESDGDEAFVRAFCEHYEIPLHVGNSKVTSGKKGLEAAAREARYAFFATLDGKIATAHTADDNAETVLLHLVRGTGLKGLGAIAPVRGNIIRPLLLATRQDVRAFLDDYSLSFREDSSNDSDVFLRNRLRHHVMPLLKKENPDLSRNLSKMALRLREDHSLIERGIEEPPQILTVAELVDMNPSARARLIVRFLKKCGVAEPEEEHVGAIERLLFSQKPSASVQMPGGVTIAREYGKLMRRQNCASIPERELPCPSEIELPELGLRIICAPAAESCLTTDRFTVIPHGPIVLRSRREGDSMRLHGGTKSLKKLLIDRKIPAAKRETIPVIADDTGVLGVYGFGANLDRTGGAVLICFERI